MGDGIDLRIVPVSVSVLRTFSEWLLRRSAWSMGYSSVLIPHDDNRWRDEAITERMGERARSRKGTGASYRVGAHNLNGEVQGGCCWGSRWK